MAKIGSLPEWLKKESLDKGFESSHERELLLNKYMQSIDSLRKENEELRRAIQIKDQSINMMALEYEPTKRNLYTKIALLCEKLQLKSAEDYEAWIEEVEVSRIRARFNEQTIEKLEITLKQYKEKIIELENMLRCLGIDLDKGQTVNFDLNDFYKSTFEIRDRVDKSLACSEKTLGELAVLASSGIPKFTQLMGDGKNKRVFKRLTLQELAVGLQRNYEEIVRKLEVLDEHENAKQGFLDEIAENIMGGVEKLFTSNLNDYFKILTLMTAKSSESKTLEAMISKNIEAKFRLDSRRLSMKKLEDLGIMWQNLLVVQKQITISSSLDQEFININQVFSNSLEEIQASEATLGLLIKIDPDIYSESLSSLLNQRSIIIQSNNSTLTDTINVITQLSNLKKKHEQLKQKIISKSTAFFEKESLFITTIKNKLDEEEEILQSYISLAGIKEQIPKPINNSLDEYLKTDHENLKIYRDCILTILTPGMIGKYFLGLKDKTNRIAKLMFKMKTLIKPGDQSAQTQCEKIQDCVDRYGQKIEEAKIQESIEIIERAFEITADFIQNCLDDIPQVVPALEDMNQVNALMKDSNFTVEVLAKAFGKEEKYKQMIDSNDVPKLEIIPDKDFQARWNMMMGYLERATTVGMKLETVKRMIIEDDKDISSIKSGFIKAQKNLYRKERALAKLVQAIPTEENMQNAAAELGKISKKRTQQLRKVRQVPEAADNFIDSHGPMAEINSEMIELLDKILEPLAKAHIPEYEEDEELPQLVWNPLLLVDEAEAAAYKKTMEDNFNSLLAAEKKKVREIEDLIENVRRDNEKEKENMIKEAQREKSDNGRKYDEMAKDMEKEKDMMRKQIGDMNNDFDAEKARLNKLINELNRNISELKAQLEKKNEEFRELDQEQKNIIRDLKSANEAEKVRSEKLVNDHFGELQALKAQSANKDDDIKQIDQGHKKLINDMKSAFDAEKARLEKLVHDLSGDLDTLKAHSANKDSNHQQLESEKANLEKHIQDLLKEHEGLKAQFAKKDTDHQQYDQEHKKQMSNLANAHEGEKAHLSKQIEDLHQELAALKALNLKKDSELQQLHEEKAKQHDLLSHHASAKQENLIQQENLEKQINEMKKKSEEIQNQAEEQIKFFEDSFNAIGQKIGEILIKTDYVGDTLMEILPENSLKTKMDRYQDQFEEVIQDIKNSKTTPDKALELLDLLDRYETANGIQSSRLSGVSDQFAHEDMERVNKSKGGLSMKAKKNLRSGRPSGKSPINALKQLVEEIKQHVAEAKAQIGTTDPVPEEPFEATDEIMYYEEISRCTGVLSKDSKEFMTVFRTLEIEREEILIQQIRILTIIAVPEMKIQLESLKDSVDKHRISQTDSFAVALSHSTVRLQLEKQLGKIREDIGYSEDLGKYVDLMDKACEESARGSIETFKLLAPSSEELKIQRENLHALIPKGKPQEIFESLENFLKKTEDVEGAKREKILKITGSKTEGAFLVRLQNAIKGNAENLEKLWGLIFKVLGKDSDKNFIKSTIFTIPSFDTENDQSISAALQETQKVFEEYVDKISKKAIEITARQDIFELAKDIEDSIDDTIRKALKDLTSCDEEALKKQAVNIKEEFDEIADSSTITIYDQFSHANSELIILNKLEGLRKKLLDALKKSLKAKDSELSALTSELDNLKSGMNADKKLIQDKLTAVETNLKEASANCEKYSKEISEDKVLIANLNNDKNDLNNTIENLERDIESLKDSLESKDSTIKSTRNNLKTKNEEVSQLLDKIRELESASNKPTVDDDVVKAMRADIIKLNEEKNALRKVLEDKEDDYLIVKRDKELLASDMKKNEESISKLRDELGQVKGKIMSAETMSRELEEKNKLGVDRNDKEISKIIDELDLKKHEVDLLKKQLEPSLNYRKLYSESSVEKDLVKKEKEANEVIMRALSDKIKELQKANDDLQYENRTIEKYKNEWLSTRETCEVLQKKIEIFNETLAKDPHAQAAIDKFTQELGEIVKEKINIDEQAKALEEKISETINMVHIVRKRNAFFRILMIGRVKNYYRFMTWKNVTAIPVNIVLEDPDLVSLYTSETLVVLPPLDDKEVEEILTSIHQKGLSQSPFKQHYRKHPMKATPMPKLNVIKELEEFLIEKANLDYKTLGSSLGYIGVPESFVSRAREIYGSPNEASQFISEFLPGLYLLSKEGCPYAILGCKLLQYKDKIPATDDQAQVILQVFRELYKIWEQSDLHTENTETAGEYYLNEVFDSLHAVLENSPELYKCILSNLDISEDQQHIKMLAIIYEFLKTDKNRNDKLSEDEKITKWVEKEQMQKVEKELSPQFYRGYTKEKFIRECKNIQIPGTSVLFSVQTGLILIKSQQIAKILPYLSSNDIISIEDFTDMVRKLAPEILAEDIEKAYIVALQQGGDNRGVTVQAAYLALSKLHAPGFFIEIPCAHVPSRGEEEKKELSKEAQEALRKQLSFSSTTETVKSKKVIKKKLSKK
ncbi:hypothetical protein SteCoe_6198 [Stentor coeruleus]|uniref:Uncharacterized protein n=1 Tax=Stentor coeruleus TaxID=5963 RepID=A0A1R2CQP1_9CILI|nr:hypothetical protein SteCoe_6198 [Stentor coeruleus]